MQLNSLFVMKKCLLSLGATLLFILGTSAQEQNWLGADVQWDRHSLNIDGQRVCPAMGEIHYSRLPADEWQQAVRKMKAGGVTIIATYVFWNHVEEQQGIFRWDGQRDLRRFLEVCKDEQMPVVLRIGPFCHGEVRNGGIPDWVFEKVKRARSLDTAFLGFVERLYRQIFTQVQGLQWKDGGPLMACQFDNEYRGSGDYLMALKKLALGIGFDLPFYTRTGWPELSKPVPFGEMLPLYGDYADGFWERTLGETDGNYYKAFHFKKSPIPSTEMGEVPQAPPSSPVGDTLAGKPAHKSNEAPSGAVGGASYPYFTCELGGGMATAYHRRPYLYPEDAYSMALVKLGSGSNLLGYYMYHGGTNPEGLTYLNENQRTPATNYNDMPVKNYDFQAPLGEFGQTYPQYYMLRPLHLFMQDYGELLAPMEATLSSSEGETIVKGDDSHLRWAVRSNAASSGADGGASAFIFINNYERLQNLSAKRNVQLSACGITLPHLNIPAGCMAILPVNIHNIRYATAQLVAHRDGNIYMMQIPGLPTTIAMKNGKTLRHVKALGASKPVCENIYLLTKDEAEHLFLAPTAPLSSPEGDTLAGKPAHKSNEAPSGAVGGALGASGPLYNKVREAGPLRTITIGKQKVAEEPQDEDFEQAAIYRITLPETALTSQRPLLLRIDYRGDVARLYADGKLVADNFYYGRPFLFGLWRLPEGIRELELRILPLQKDAPIYLPREADKTPGEEVKSITMNYMY